MVISRSIYIVLLLSILHLLIIYIRPNDAAARTIKVPLISAKTPGAGVFGQPVINFYAPIGLGTPPKKFNVQFDVGLSEPFVPHYKWNPFKINLHYSKGFQCAKSTSCNRTNRSFTLDYQNCRLEGKSYEDIMTLTNAYGPGVVSVSIRQKFLGISDASDARFKDLPVDGYFGLGPLTQTPSGATNIIDSLRSANYIDNNQFSFWFNPILDSPQGGELILGGVDQTRYQGKIFWHPLIGVHSQWTIGLQHVGIGGQTVGCFEHGCEAVLSTGLNEVYGPRDEVNKIYRFLNTSHQESGLELIDCRRRSSLPLITFTIHGIPYVLLPSNYVRKTTDGGIFKSETCYVAILASDKAGKWILGTNFIGSYYTIFDMTYRQVGFATLR